MARNTRFAWLALVAGLSFFCSVEQAQAAPRKTDLYRTWVVEGSDTIGDYAGTLTIADGGRWKVSLDASLTYDDGTERHWTSSGYYVFGRIYCRYTLDSLGMIGGLANLAGSTEVLGRLLPNQYATRLIGRYRTDDETFAGDDECFRQGRAGFGLRWSRATLGRVMAAHGLTDEDALLLEAANHDDGNGYLRRSELEAAALALAAAARVGIISDIDKTLLPPHVDGDPLPAAYPGVSMLYWELAQPGATTYVTARTPDRIVGVADWMSDNDLPEGTIETGVSGLPWVARPEKVRDIERTLAANPGMRFVFFGDSSHVDPEAFKDILANHPDRVVAVFIHKVNVTVSAHRVEGMHLIENYAQAAALLFHAGVIDEAAARRVMRAARDEGLSLTNAEIDALLGS